VEREGERETALGKKRRQESKKENKKQWRKRERSRRIKGVEKKKRGVVTRNRL